MRCAKPGDIARHYYGGEYRRWSKSRGEPVTEADLAIDKYLQRARWARAAQTMAGCRRKPGRDDPATRDTPRIFIVDPIDGTTAFLKERPHFSISVAVVEHGRARGGVVYNPILEEFFSALGRRVAHG